ncbi:MAG: LamG domain-containing protein [Mariniblastus sp.]
MSNESSDSDLQRLGELMRKMVQGELSEREMVELNNCLESSEQAREYYLDYVDVETLMVEHWGPANTDDTRHGATPVVEGAGQKIPLPAVPRSLTENRWSNAASIAVVMLMITSGLLAANLYFMWPTDRSPLSRVESVQQGPLDTSPVNPQIVSMTACVWNGETEPSIGGSVRFGEVLELLEGIADFQVSNEYGELARIRIEGPASVFVRSDGQLGLRSGALTAQFDCDRGGFDIDTGMGMVSIPGRAYVGIEDNGAVKKLHVFEGTALVRHEWPYERMLESTVVSENEAIACQPQVDGTIRFTRFEADKSAFASSRTMGFDLLDLTDVYRDTVMQSKPEVYWRFENQFEVSNEMSDRLPAVVDGEIHFRKFGQNSTAEFGLSSSRGVFVSDGLWPKKALETYTVELWVKPSHFQNGALIGLCLPRRNSSGKLPHSMYLELGGPFNSRTQTKANRFRFLHRSPPSEDPNRGTSSYSEGDYAVRTWQYVVARKSKDRLDLFIDGELVGTSQDSSSLPAGMQIVVGQLYPNQASRPFFGQLDELALYGRALSDEEILTHFKARGLNDEPVQQTEQ